MTDYWWDNASMVFYICMGIVPVLSVYCAKIYEQKKNLVIGIKNRYYISWMLIWLIITVWRRVAYGFGGSDARSYVQYFVECLDPDTTSTYAAHVEIAFRWLNKLIRFFTDDYHIFFLLIYGAIILAYQLFVKEYHLKNTSVLPLVLLFYVYLQGFSSIRTTLSIACILFGIMALYKDKRIMSVMLFILSVLTHFASIFYAAFYLFYYLYRKGKIKLWHGGFWSISAVICARTVQYIMLNTALGELIGGASAYYVSRSARDTFFGGGGWKTAFGQLLLLIAVFVFNKKIKRFIAVRDGEDQRRFELVFMMCFYDFLMIPVCYILGIWRGYEYFYMPRLLIWGVIVELICKKFVESNRRYIRICFLLAFVAWMVFREYNTGQLNGTMPYIFEPLAGLWE